MSYKLSWLVPGRVIDAVLPVMSNDDALIQAFDIEINAMLDTASQPVNIILDVRFVQENPSTPSAMKMTYFKHRNTARLILIGMVGNPIMRFLVSIIGSGKGVQIKDFKTREEAQAYLASVEQL